MNGERLRSARSTAVLAALAVVGVLLAAQPASAAVIDAGRTGSITIHRFERPPVSTGLPADGSPVDTTGLAPIEGVEYAIRRVQGVDLATNAGWALAVAASAGFDANDPIASLLAVPGITGLGAAIATVTDATGSATAGPVPVGLYLVSEESRPPGVEPAAPVVVAVPLTDPATSEWRYDVHIYPKGDVFRIDKSVEDRDLVAVGEAVSYRIATPIPDSAPIEEYRITDQLDPRLGFLGARVEVSDGVDVTAGIDYLVDVDGANRLTVEFTEAGLGALESAPGGAVELLVTVTVDGVGAIANQATLEVDSASLSGSFLSPIAELRMGSVTLRKVNGAGSPLTGAVFALYRSEADALADRDRIELAGDTEFAVDPSGEAVISGLRHSDFSGGGPVPAGDAGYRTYWLSELIAPSGYRPLSAPIEVAVTDATSSGSTALVIENLPFVASTPPPLAFTGFAIGGAAVGAAALLALGVLFAVVPALRRRKRESSAR